MVKLGFSFPSSSPDLDPPWVNIDGIDGIAVKDLRKLSDLFHAIEGTQSHIRESC